MFSKEKIHASIRFLLPWSLDASNNIPSNKLIQNAVCSEFILNVLSTYTQQKNRNVNPMSS